MKDQTARWGQGRFVIRLALGLTLLACPGAGMAESQEADDSKQFEVKYSNGLQFNRKDGAFKLKLGGRIQWDVAGIMVDDELRAAVSGGNGVGTECRRCRLYLSGTLFERVIFKAQYDFADGADLKDVWVGMKGLGPVGTLKIGHMKEFYSLEELMSSNDLTFIERALPAVFDPSRNVGIAASNHHLDGRLTWGLGVYLPTDDSGFSFSDQTQVNLTGRLTGLPFYADEGRRLVHLGFAVSQQFRDGQDVRYRQRPEVHLANRYVDTGNVATRGNTLIGAEAAWVEGPLSLQLEYQGSWIDRVGDSFAYLQGVYVQGSWLLTGEHRPYKKSSAVFSRIKPNEPFNPWEGTWGAWEVAVRYSWLDLDDSGLNGGREQNVTAGLNWHLYSQLKVMLNYVWADVQDTGDRLGNASGNVNSVYARMQLTF